MTNGDYIREFLSHMGVQADVRVNVDNEKIIVIDTQVYHARRAFIETWFTLIEQTEKYSYFRERARGTGQTV